MNRRSFLKGALGLAAATVAAPQVIAEAAERLVEVPEPIVVPERRYWALGSIDPAHDDFQHWTIRGDFDLNYPQRFVFPAFERKVRIGDFQTDPGQYPGEYWPYHQTTIHVGQSYNPEYSPSWERSHEILVTRAEGARKAEERMISGVWRPGEDLWISGAYDAGI